MTHFCKIQNLFHSSFLPSLALSLLTFHLLLFSFSGTDEVCRVYDGDHAVRFYRSSVSVVSSAQPFKLIVSRLYNVYSICELITICRVLGILACVFISYFHVPKFPVSQLGPLFGDPIFSGPAFWVRRLQDDFQYRLSPSYQTEWHIYCPLACVDRFIHHYFAKLTEINVPLLLLEAVSNKRLKIIPVNLTLNTARARLQDV